MDEFQCFNSSEVSCRKNNNPKLKSRSPTLILFATDILIEIINTSYTLFWEDSRIAISVIHLGETPFWKMLTFPI